MSRHSAAQTRAVVGVDSARSTELAAVAVRIASTRALSHTVGLSIAAPYPEKDSGPWTVLGAVAGGTGFIPDGGDHRGPGRWIGCGGLCFRA
ncbi:hypothetical protein [Corynebacterium sp. TAE3-ERU16]|uniref:hypothetical protein n=1 Tax=Corynebacterium sp. TAE3-ERU16 TaxID=2849493 RepID=UPI001C48E957|nr:hypothetical protein [Corynebacterium sp. TAE3-ERU16]MBV7294210.1 hypothetical protein [Corynebacterium sp. TAE3-ERU16]